MKHLYEVLYERIQPHCDICHFGTMAQAWQRGVFVCSEMSYTHYLQAQKYKNQKYTGGGGVLLATIFFNRFQ